MTRFGLEATSEFPWLSKRVAHFLVHVSYLAQPQLAMRSLHRQSMEPLP